MRSIELTAKEFKELLDNSEISIGLASRTLHLFNDREGFELIMNYEGYGYKPVKISIDFEYDENIKFAEDD